jgi:hypothetical protein
MSEEDINATIAKLLGWKLIGWGNYTSRLLTEKPEGYCFEVWLSPSGVEHDSPPDYCSDLNAMHEAENFFASAEQLRNYEDILDDGNGGHSATARQRAEAFLRTLGKWEEAK